MPTAVPSSLWRYLQNVLWDSRYRIALVALSALFTLLRAGTLRGSIAALLLVVGFQLYLPGILLVRILGKLSAGHPITRFVWVLVSGMSLTIVLAAAARLLQVPVSAYVLLLHLFLLVMAVCPAFRQGENAWHWQRRDVPCYLLVGLCCIAALWVGFERSQIRYDSYEDQTVFIEQANWLANNPDDPDLRSRRVGVSVGDPRADTDGWTYTHAVWEWTSGVPAADIIWYYLTPLLIWTIPLVTFALGFELTQRTNMAAWSATALTITALLTLASFAYLPIGNAFGAAAFAQLNTLRMMSRALLLPAALFVGVAYLRVPRGRDLILLLLVSLALGSVHPQQLMTFLVVIAAVAILRWLAVVSADGVFGAQRQSIKRAAILLVVFGVLVALAYVQRQRYISTDVYAQQLEQYMQAGSAISELPDYSNEFMFLFDLPIVGTTYVVKPTFVFNQPLIILAVGLGLAAGFGWRKSYAAQFIFASTLVVLMLLFVPGLTRLFAQLTFLPAVPGLIFGLPVAVTFGLAVAKAQDWLERLPATQRTIRWVIAGGFTAAILLLVLEPIPIPASARDQIRASNEIQSKRAMLPADELLLESLTALLPPDQRSILLTPNRIGNYVVESVPHTLITGGRGSNLNVTFVPTLRFYSSSEFGAPWLDSRDIDFIRTWNVSHIVMEADDTRLPQLLLQSDRFELMDMAAGYYIFRVLALNVTTTDARFNRMNAIYAGLNAPRWEFGDFHLERPANAAAWQDVTSELTAALEPSPDDDAVRYGLALSYLMSDDERALPLWRTLHERYPLVPQFTDFLAYTLAHYGEQRQSIEPLLAALDSSTAAVRVSAAQTLLTAEFFYLLDDAQIEQVLNVTQQNAVVWQQIAEHDAPERIRDRASLLMSAGRTDAASAWLNNVAAAEMKPEDVLAQAMIALSQGDVEGALSVLQPTTDGDWVAPKAYLHPDRWQTNMAAQSYYLLLGELAVRSQRWNDAIQAYQAAIDYGSIWAGRYFLARTYEYSGSAGHAETMLNELYTDWAANHTEPFPDLVSLLTMADARALYVMQSHIIHDYESHLTVSATYGNPFPHGFPVQAWRLQITGIGEAAATTYALADAPSLFIDGALTRATITIDLPPDIDMLTPAQIYVEPRYDNRVTYPPLVQDIVLNRPPAAQAPASAHPLHLAFGTEIMLESYDAALVDGALQLTLYWEAQSTPDEDYQVFVHVVDSSGQIVLQQDSSPVSGRYPMRQWRTNTLIADQQVLPLSGLSPDETYRVRVGMYRQSDMSRLAISPVQSNVEDDSVWVYTFELE